MKPPVLRTFGGTPLTLPGRTVFGPLARRLRSAYRRLRGGQYSVLLSEIMRQLHSETLSFGLRRDLQINFPAPKAKIDISIRQLENEDLASLLDASSQDPAEQRVVSDQQGIVKAGIPGCYVAVTSDGKPCYMQWLISSEYNKLLEDHFQGIFPPLKKSEALLEGAYTPPAFRGLGIMPVAMARIAEQAAVLPARWVITFVGIDNIPSLKGCRRAGFEPFVFRKDRWFLFWRTVSFQAIPNSQLEHYHKNTAEKASK